MASFRNEEGVLETLFCEGLVESLRTLEQEVGITAGEEVKLDASLLEGSYLLSRRAAGCGERADVIEHLRIEV